jgi:hypothetical protein
MKDEGRRRIFYASSVRKKRERGKIYYQGVWGGGNE